MRECILQCLGAFPQKTDLNLKVIGTEQCDSYTRYLIEYNVEKDERVQSYLLVPNGLKAKNPAILAIHQHAGNWEVGKSEVVGLTNDKMYSYGLDLVKRGYVVIAPDIICFESRMGEGEFKKTREDQKAYERFLFCDYLVNGKTLQGKTLNDLSVAIDVLCALDYVDKDNIGVIGHSLGGQESIWLQWYDERIKAGVSSCGVSEIKDIIANGVLHNFYLYVPNMLMECDMDELIYEITLKRGLLISSGLKDEEHFPLSGIEKIEERIQNVNFKSIRFDGGHQFGETEKEEAYGFLDMHLKI